MVIWNAGIRYGLFAFGLGFFLGTLRVLFIAPQLGAGAAVILELPIMLAACWWCAGVIVRRYPPSDRNEALAIGLIGFAVLIAGEFAIGVGMMNQTPAGWIRQFALPTPQLGLTAQLLAAAMPLLRCRRVKSG
jgi:hypothetical protein